MDADAKLAAEILSPEALGSEDALDLDSVDCLLALAERFEAAAARIRATLGEDD